MVNRPVPLTEHPWQNADWDSLRVLLAVARVLSFRKAAEETGISIDTLRRAVLRLEDQFGYPLFYRETEGVRLTPEGRRIVAACRPVENLVSDVWQAAVAAGRESVGPIRLAITEGLGTFWLTPRIVDYIEESAAQNRIEVQ